jgi:hypothetical protein
LSSELRGIKPGALVKILRSEINCASCEIGLVTALGPSEWPIWNVKRWWVLTANGKLDYYSERILEILEVT